MKKGTVESSIYFTQREIYDALMSSKKVMSISLLMELAKDRGILISSEDTREEIIEYLSYFVYDYYDLNTLIDHITPAHKKEKSKVTQLNTVVDTNDIQKASKDITNNQNDKTIINVVKDIENPNKTIVNISWEEIDYGKNRLRQKIRRESSVEIIEKNGLTTISKDSNDTVDKIMETMFQKVSETKDLIIKEEKINLYGLTFQVKTQYFTDLINSVEDCKLVDVIKVSVNKEDEFDTEEDILNMITKASFRGVGLLNTEEYQKLKDTGYFITSIIWQSEETKKDGDKIEFEATLSISKKSEELTFAPKGIFRSQGKGEYTKTKRPLKEEEIIKYTKKLEELSFKIYKDILNKEE